MIEEVAPLEPLTTRVLGFREWTFSWVLDPDAPMAVYDGGRCVVPPTYYLVNGERVSTLLGSNQQHWRPGTNRARCHWDSFNRYYYHSMNPKDAPRRPAPHSPPGSQCGCGLYGLHGAHKFTMVPRTGNSVVGAISGWGKLEVHKDGFRAEYARVETLGFDPAQGIAVEERIRQTAEAFGVPCIEIDDLPALALEYAEPIPVELRGPTEVSSHAGGVTQVAEAA